MTDGAPAGPPRVAVVGSLNMDITVGVPRLPRAGETVLGGESRFAGGGKGANQAVAAARLGAAVSLVGRLGRDAHGRVLHSLARADGIDLRGVSRGPQPTGLALILVGERGENLIAVAPGANAALTPADVARASSRIQAADVLVAQLEVPLETVAAAVRVARDAGVTVLLNAAPARGDLADLLPLVDVLVVNEVELAALAGSAPAHDEAAAVRRLRERGVSRIVVTLGARGALAADGDGMQVIPGAAVQVVDTTGAGDCFVGGLATRLASGAPLADAVRYACAAAALSCTRHGAQPSMPTAAEVDAALHAAPPREDSREYQLTRTS